MNTLPKINHLILFQEVVRCGSIRAAARSLKLTQPSVTKTIRDIENYFGMDLMLRSHNGIELTDAGKLLLPHSQTIINDLNDIVNDMRSLKTEPKTTVAFGFPSLIGFTAISEIVAKFNNQYSRVQLKMEEAQLSSLVNLLREGHLDFAIGNFTQDLHVQNLTVRPLFNAEFAYFAHKDHPLAKCETQNSLRQAWWILPQTDSGYYQKIYKILKMNDIQFNRLVRTDSIASIINMVTKADFITILAREMCTPFGMDIITEIPIKEKLPLAHFSLIQTKNKRVSLEAKTLISFFCNYDWSIFSKLDK